MDPAVLHRIQLPGGTPAMDPTRSEVRERGCAHHAAGGEPRPPLMEESRAIRYRRRAAPAMLESQARKRESEKERVAALLGEGRGRGAARSREGGARAALLSAAGPWPPDTGEAVTGDEWIGV